MIKGFKYKIATNMNKPNESLQIRQIFFSLPVPMLFATISSQIFAIIMVGAPKKVTMSPQWESRLPLIFFITSFAMELNWIRSVSTGNGIRSLFWTTSWMVSSATLCSEILIASSQCMMNQFEVKSFSMTELRSFSKLQCGTSHGLVVFFIFSDKHEQKMPLIQ